MLVDGFGRTHDNLRISVTDRCNIRCFYCMPEQGVEYLPRSEILDRVKTSETRGFQEVDGAIRQARVALEAMRLLPRGADNVFAGVAAMLAALQHGLSLRARAGERRPKLLRIARSHIALALKAAGYAGVAARSP